MNLNENADIRRAIDRLQQAVEVLNDRHREMRRERKQLRERVDELTQEREIAVAAASSQLDAAAAERTRAIKLEERARAAEASASELNARVVELERVLADRDIQLGEYEQGNEDLAALRTALVREQRERALLEEKHLQAIGKLDAATRAEAMARTDAAAASTAKLALEEMNATLLEEKAALETELASGGAGDGAMHAAELEARESDLRAAHEALTQREQEHSTALAKVEGALAAADLERERLEGRLADLQEQNQVAQSVAEGLREQLASAGDTDDERIKSLHARVGELAGELAESRKHAAERDEAAAEALREAETLHSRIAGMEDEIRHLKATGVANGMPSLFEDEERKLIAEQIDNAINLIDRHLAGGT